MPSITVFPDKTSWTAGAAEFLLEQANTALAQRGRWTVALAGGNTPRPVYELLATPDYTDRLLDWSRVFVFFSDERCVPPADARSNYAMARAALLDRVPLPAANVLRMAGEDDPAQAAFAYEQALQHFFRTPAPVFDLICLGLGDNGHTASLFPGTASLRERNHAIAAQYVEVMQSWRLTMTLPLINAARHVAFLVEGAGKAAVVQQVQHGAYQPDVLPAQLIQPQPGQLHWLLDAAAAGASNSQRYSEKTR
ncbi:MAG: 6-phosphogluconolactonase [Anaerolineae bacterium]